MTWKITAAAMVAAALLWAAPAAAQQQPTLSLAPAIPARWDVAGHAGWFSAHKPEVGAEWDDWYNAGLGGISAGYLFTPHVKADVHVAFSTEGRIFFGESIVVPGQPFPIFRTHEHFFQTSAFGASASYQFFENQWIHPAIGAGLEAVRERHRVYTPQQFAPSRDPIPLVIPASSGPAEVSIILRPFLTTGVKFYVTERSFVRTDLRSSFSTRGLSHVVWTAGIGVDL
jgi:hypothetical protein